MDNGRNWHEQRVGNFVHQHHRIPVLTHLKQLRMVVITLTRFVALLKIDLYLHRSNSTHSSVGERKPPESMEGEVMPG